MKLAEIRAGAVVNIISVDPNNIPPFLANWPKAPDEVQIGWGYDGEAFTDPGEIEPEPATLSPAQFAWLMARTGLEDVWDALEGALKVDEPETYALLRAQRHRTIYTQEGVLRMLSGLRPVAAQIAPDMDLSDGAIKSVWAAAQEAPL